MSWYKFRFGVNNTKSSDYVAIGISVLLILLVLGLVSVLSVYGT